MPRPVVDAASESRLYLLTERVPRLLGRLPGTVPLVPNQERFPLRHLGRLRHVDHVLCKTRHAESIFRDHAKHVSYIGFTSMDRLMIGVVPDYDRFLHLAGKSTLKGTKTLLDAWGQHPEWPELTVVHSDHRTQLHSRGNVRVIGQYLPDAVLQRLQNECGVHLCPSQSEGWGHYTAEAMSCEAVVLTTDGAPMNESVTPDRGVLVPWNRSTPRHLGTNWHVDPQALEIAIRQIMDYSDQQKRQLGQAAREWYEDNDQQFQMRFRDTSSWLLSHSTIE